MTPCCSLGQILYSQPARLYFGQHLLWSTTGIQQGDPSVPFLFCFSFAPTITTHSLWVPAEITCSVFGWWDPDWWHRTSGCSNAQHSSSWVSSSNALDLKKTEIYWRSLDPGCSGVFPRDMPWVNHGVKLLDGAVNTKASFITGFSRQQVEKTPTLMNLLAQTKDLHYELVLLRVCTGLAKLGFSLCTCPQEFFEEAAQLIDQGFRKVLQVIAVYDG